MPDLLTHVLIGYVLGTLITRRTTRPAPAMTTVVMLGALLPDLTKVQLLFTDARLEAALGIPFSWWALHTLGGVFVTASVGALLAGTNMRRRVFVLLFAGAVSHLLLDSLLSKPSGHAPALWWPFLRTGLPTPGLYVSSDRWPAILAGVLALAVSRWPPTGTTETP